MLKVVDGDTIHVSANGQKLRSRMIGLDTPETVDPRKPVQCFGKRPRRKPRPSWAVSRYIWRPTPARTPSISISSTLAYVWTASGRLFNLDMIADGYAFEYTYDLPYRYQADFKAAEADASANDRGLWSPNTCAA